MIRASILNRPMLAGLTVMAVSGCTSLTVRSTPSIPLNATAIVEGLTNVRARADVVSEPAEQIVKYQYSQIIKTHGAGSVETRKADFLAISGGGADGAFAAGFLKGWSSSGRRPEFEVVTGVSAGALVAPFAFLGRDYDSELKSVFTGISDKDIYVDKGILGLVGESLLDTTPLRSLIERILTEKFLDAIAAQESFGRLLLIQTTDIERQVPYLWNITRIAATGGTRRRQLITDILLASAAIPGVFPPVRVSATIDGKRIQELHVDGGLAAQVFFAPAGLDLRKFERKYFGRTRKETLYMIRNGKLAPETKPVQIESLELAKQAIATLIKYQSNEDIYRIRTSLAATGLETHLTAIPRDFDQLQDSEFSQQYMQALYKAGQQIGSGENRWVEAIAPR